jgi:hypothetical protein
MELHFPAEQMEQEFFPVNCWYIPGLQGIQSFASLCWLAKPASSVRNVPAGHESQALCPSAMVYCPDEHTVQVSFPLKGLDLPKGHFLQSSS